MQSQRQIVNLIGSALDGINKSGRASIWDALEEEFGLQKIGSGAYGAVFRHPTNYDLVVKVGYDKEDGWLDYAAFCMANYPGNPELLVVHAVRLFKFCFVAVVERLDYVSANDPLQDLRKAWYMDEALTPVLQKLQYEHGSFHDLHPGNVMQRDGQLVITDPYARGSSSYRQYLSPDGRIDPNRRSATPEPVSGVNYVAEMNNVLGPKEIIPAEKFAHGIILDDCMRKQWHDAWAKQANWRIPKIGEHVFVQLKKRDEHAEPISREGALVVKDGSPASIRAEKEDRMLRVRSKHDNTAYVQGVQRALLPFCRSRRVQTARIAIIERTAGPAAGYKRNVGWAIKPAVRFHPKHPPEQDAVAA